MNTKKAGSAHAGPALDGTDDEALLTAMRNLWPILSPEGRQTAIQTAHQINSKD